MTRLGKRELVNKIELKSNPSYYSIEQLEQLASLGIVCYEIGIDHPKNDDLITNVKGDLGT